MSRFTSEYGRRVQTARVTAGLTQAELASRLDLTRSSVANVEAGRQAASAEQVIQTAEALGCDPRWLLTGWETSRATPAIGVPAKAVTSHVAALRQLANDLEAAGGQP